MLKLEYAIALTGSIGSGKSTLVSFLSLYGYQNICADKVAHQVLEDFTPRIIEHFGESILKENGKISRKKLGQIVFSSTHKRRELEALIHPEIRSRILHQAQKLEVSRTWYFLDIPLFFEVGGKEAYPVKRVVVIYTPREQAIKRIVQRDSCTLAEAEQRLLSQMPIEEKCRLADNVIDNSGDLKLLQQHLESFLYSLKDHF